MSTPSHDEIAHRAHQLWHEYGSPAGQDESIWLAAEQQLTARLKLHETAAPATFAERTRSATAAESLVENQISPAIPDAEAIRAALQKQTARAPQVPHHLGPKGKPPETGKPLWNQPHSS